MILHFHPTELQEKKFLLFLSHPFYAILLEQPTLTKPPILVSYGCPPNYHQLHGLKQWALILTVLEARMYNQDVNWTVLSPEGLGENSSLPLPDSGSPRHPLACGCVFQPPSPSSRGLLFFLPVIPLCVSRKDSLSSL